MRFFTPCTAALAIACLAASAALAQQEAQPAHTLVSLHAGAALIGTGDHNCGVAASVVAGARTRTAGRAFLALTGDLHVGLPLVCTDAVTVVPDGTSGAAYRDGGTFFTFAPRLGARLGHEVALGGTAAEVSVGGGMVLSTDVDDSEPTLQPWASFATGLRLPRTRWSLELELGAHRVPMELHSLRLPAVYPAPPPERFHRWEPLLQLGVRRGL